MSIDEIAGLKRRFECFVDYVAGFLRGHDARHDDMDARRREQDARIAAIEKRLENLEDRALR